MFVKCEPELWQPLAGQILYELERRSDLVAFNEHIKDLAEEIKAADERPAGSCKLLHKLHGESQRLNPEELK